VKIQLAYGTSGIEADFPADAQIVNPVFAPGLADEADAILQALRSPIHSRPLKELAKRGDKVVVAHSDMTRAVPNQRMLPVVLQELESAGVRREDITLLCALGTHRRQTEAEMRDLLGDFLIDRYRCVQHDAFNDSTLVSLGETNLGHPVRLNRLLVEADLKVLTGFIEPHLYAGFSGGPKCVLPGLAGSESVQTNHGVDMIGHPNATWGITHGNPLWEEMMEMAQRLEDVFLLNVTMNNLKQITGVFAGDLSEAHRAGCEFARQHAMVKVDAPFDVVVATNSGYPLDQNLYQCGKAMSVASRIVRRGGAILVAAACADGLPDGSHYARLLERVDSVEAIRSLLATPGFFETDQWMLQVQLMVQENAEVHIFSEGLTEAKIRRALCIPCRDLEQGITDLLRQYGPRICVLPEGPQAIPYL